VTVHRGEYKHARFEIVVEILARKISNVPEYFIRHCRVFGDSPKPLQITELQPLVEKLVDEVCRPMLMPQQDEASTSVSRDEPGLDALTDLTRAIYTGVETKPTDDTETDDTDDGPVAAGTAAPVPGPRKSTENLVPEPPTAG
jgi:hypothetical protein